MELVTFVADDGTYRAGRVEGDEIVSLDAPSVREVLEAPDWRATAADTDGPRVLLGTATLAPVVPNPSKIVCVGVNYRDHIEEMGREVPGFPTYFAKYARALVGPRGDLVLPAADVTTHVDWEVELAIVIGAPARNVSGEDAQAAIAGYTVLNDVSIRDWQRRTSQFLAGKTFEGLTPLGPGLVTSDVLGDGSGLALSTSVNGVVK
ncbi:MAG: fumarylacetoacetate hydrolase family protein, partial [Actinomycetota bacterium]